MSNKEIIELRRVLHSNPELSNAEYNTAEIIKDFIKKYNPTQIIEGIGGHGLAAIYKFQKEGKTITIRCELDALPIQEINAFNHKSKIEGVSHKCGHDGHMAIVSSLAIWLNKKELDSGTVILLFQPAEETGEGAARVIMDKKYLDLQSDYVFALHNIPKEPMHSIILMDRGFSAEVISFAVKLKGKESHAAEPENGINPALCISQLINLISKLNNSSADDETFAILTPVHINMGQMSYGISAGKGEMHYTIRTWDPRKMENLKSRIERILEQTVRAHSLEYEVEWLEYFPASANDKECNNYVRMAAVENKFDIIEKSHPFKFGEDFGWYSRNIKTTMFGVGSGIDTPALHSTDYDFPDELISTGVAMFKSIIWNILKDH